MCIRCGGELIYQGIRYKNLYSYRCNCCNLEHNYLKPYYNGSELKDIYCEEL